MAVNKDPMPIQSEVLLTTREAARLLRVTEATLRTWRCQRRGPVCLRITSRLVRYRLRDIEEWLNSQQKAGNVKEGR